MIAKRSAFTLAIFLLTALVVLFNKTTADEHDIVLFGEEAKAQLAKIDDSILVWPDENTYVLEMLRIQANGGYVLTYQSVDETHRLSLQLIPVEIYELDGDVTNLRPDGVAIDTTGAPGVMGEVVAQGPVSVRGKPGWRAREVYRTEQREFDNVVVNWLENDWDITMAADADMYEVLPTLAENLVWHGQRDS
nr:hypothetical protein [Ardenticatena sp.]